MDVCWLCWPAWLLQKDLGPCWGPICISDATREDVVPDLTSSCRAVCAQGCPVSDWCCQEGSIPLCAAASHSGRPWERTRYRLCSGRCVRTRGRTAEGEGSLGRVDAGRTSALRSGRAPCPLPEPGKCSGAHLYKPSGTSLFLSPPFFSIGKTSCPSKLSVPFQSTDHRDLSAPLIELPAQALMAHNSLWKWIWYLEVTK